MSNLNIAGSSLGNALQTLLMCDDLQPGDEPSYQVCKAIYEFHPLGAKMAESPISMAQSQPRELAVPGAPEKVMQAFIDEWKKIGADQTIHTLMTTARIYGVASMGVLAEGVPSDRPINPKEFVNLKIAFNIWDPLNTAGSLVLNQDPNALDFQKHSAIMVSGQHYHRSRTITVMNERPIYIGYTNSAFGYVGRSVYQRAFFPLRSFVKTMIADDMVATKVGVIIAKMKQAGSIIDNAMMKMFGLKRNIVKEAQTYNVVGIGIDETIESLNLQNLDGPLTLARKDILENVAVAADMPAKLLNSETFAEGFGEGTEDAKYVAKYIDRIREEMSPAYGFFDKIVQYRAWNQEFYAILQKQFPDEYGQKPYRVAFYEWVNAFHAEWPSLLIEPNSEKIKVEEVKFKSAIEASTVMLPLADPTNKAKILAWMQDAFNEQKMLFKNPLELDFELLTAYLEQADQMKSQLANAGEDDPSMIVEPKEKKSFADAQSHVLRIGRSK